MGISGLLSLLKPIQKSITVASFAGKTAGVDAYCWLHKGAYGCAMELVEGKKSQVYVNYVLRRVDMLLHYNVKPILVFDGGYLPSKSQQEESRRKLRSESKAKGLAFLRAGNRTQAQECFQKCVDITPEMALEVIKACRSKGVECIVAPYEADAQLCYLMKSGLTQVTITEDSDLLVYGCQKVIFKMDVCGNGTLIDLSDLSLLEKLKMHEFTQEKFRHMCILSGCDYLPSIKGMGLITANKLLRKSSSVHKLLQSVRIDGKMKVPDDYEKRFKQADETFLYQLVFDPTTESLVPLTPLPDGMQPGDLEFAGPALSKEKTLAIAVGNINPITGQVMAEFDPHCRASVSDGTVTHDKSLNGRRLCLTPGASLCSGVERITKSKDKEYDVQKNLNGLMLHSAPSEQTRRPFVPPSKKRKQVEEEGLGNDSLASQYTELKPRRVTEQRALEGKTRKTKFRNPFRVGSDEVKSGTGEISRYFNFSSPPCAADESCVPRTNKAISDFSRPGDPSGKPDTMHIVPPANTDDGQEEKENIGCAQPVHGQDLTTCSEMNRESPCSPSKRSTSPLSTDSSNINERDEDCMKMNLLSRFGFHRTVGRKSTESFTQARRVLETVELDSGYLSDVGSSTDCDTPSPSHSSSAKQPGSAVGVKTTRRAIQMKAKKGVPTSALGRCRSLGISKRQLRQKCSGSPAPGVSTLLAYFHYDKKRPKLESSQMKSSDESPDHSCLLMNN